MRWIFLLGPMWALALGGCQTAQAARSQADDRECQGMGYKPLGTELYLQCRQILQVLPSGSRRLEFAGRTADDLQHLGGCRPLLQRLGELARASLVPGQGQHRAQP
jgi:hypothetical protein